MMGRTFMTSGNLQRDLGVFDAMMLGLGSILGTGIFVSIGLAAGIAGTWVVLAIPIAALVATANALSSAQLAAAHPVSGGTYEYGYRFLRPGLGFLAGWMFLVAKSASAATAALGFAGYSLVFLGYSDVSKVAVALCAVVVLTAIVLAGVRRSKHVNLVIVGFTIFSLILFVAAGFWFQIANSGGPGVHSFSQQPSPLSIPAILHASALMFVAYAGYGRIATLAEEVHEPRRNIPRAIIWTLGVSAFLYIIVSLAGVGSVGADFLYRATEGEAAPLELAAREMGFPLVSSIVAIGAATAMLGVLLNLILGLSRVYLAMGRRRDMPHILARLDRHKQTPWVAVTVTGLFIASLTLIGSVRTTWSFSAFTVLVYYAITNLAALMMPGVLRIFPRWISFAGLSACLLLAFWVDPIVWVSGIAIGVIGLSWFVVAGKIRGRSGLS
jgi:APA family basic amino acid/polyamine antiporter